jgi:SAM-dependent methyltransferase
LTQTVFGADYAAAYDALYQDKDYSAECDLIEQVFRRYAKSNVQRVLDLGCGTGKHAAVLAERGYHVLGVDRSPEMLRLARSRNPSVRFEQGDIVSVRLDEKFDAVLVMFAVLGYLSDNADVRRALSVARQHLEPGGVVLADVWYGPAVLAERPSERVKVIDAPTGGQVIRVASSQLDIRRNLCHVNYQLWRLDGERLCAHVREQHSMRYFFEPELEQFLAEAGFELRRLGAFPNFDDDPSEHTWNIAAAACAR